MKYFGLRTVKTGLAVALSVLVVRLFPTEPLSVFYAAFGALVAMDRTLSGSLTQGLTQLVGVLMGTVFGYLAALFFPAGAPAWLVGLGIMLLIILCNALKVAFAISLSCIIFLSAVLTPTDNIVLDALFRLRDTSLGLGIALAVNAALRPYNNKKRILSLVQQLMRQLPRDVELLVVHERFPSTESYVELLRRMDLELKLYHAQHLFHRKHNDEALLYGCRQLSGRMVEELEVICGMDSLGDVSMEIGERLLKLGLELPEAKRKCTRHDTIVMNYHLDKLLNAYTYLQDIITDLSAA